ncbi:MAG: hypothetical protein R6V28_11115 [Nitriliruptoraceae bacterium]
MTTSIALGPATLGLVLATEVAVEDGWAVRGLHVPDGLDGPPGILQGGLAAGLAVGIARMADTYGAPLTRVQARLHAPTPVASSVTARVGDGDAVGSHVVEIRNGDTALVSAEVELAGHDPAPLGLDLLDLATGPFPEPVRQDAYPTCFVCGPNPRHPAGLRLPPRPRAPDAIVQPWIPDAALTGDRAGVVDPLLVAAVLDCPTVWAGFERLREAGYAGALLAGFHLQVFRDLPVEEPVRVVARWDGLDGRKGRARAALVDEERTIYALASALHVAVTELPGV